MGKQRGVSWRRVLGFLEHVGGARSHDDLIRTIVQSIPDLVPFDAEGGFFDAGGRCRYAHGSSPERIRSYTEYYRYLLPFRGDGEEGRARQCPSGVVINEWNARYADSEYVADFLRPGGVWKSAVLFLPGTRQAIALHRSRACPAFSDAERRVLGAVGPHLSNHLAILAKLASATHERVRAAELALDCRLLTRREAQIARYLALRMSAREIGSVLLVSSRTVERHIANMYEKLGVHGRPDLLRRLYGGSLGEVRD